MSTVDTLMQTAEANLEAGLISDVLPHIERAAALSTDPDERLLIAGTGIQFVQRVHSEYSEPGTPGYRDLHSYMRMAYEVYENASPGTREIFDEDLPPDELRPVFEAMERGQSILGLGRGDFARAKRLYDEGRIDESIALLDRMARDAQSPEERLANLEIIVTTLVEQYHAGRPVPRPGSPDYAALRGYVDGLYNVLEQVSPAEKARYIQSFGQQRISMLTDLRAALLSGRDLEDGPPPNAHDGYRDAQRSFAKSILAWIVILGVLVCVVLCGVSLVR